MFVYLFFKWCHSYILRNRDDIIDYTNTKSKFRDAKEECNIK